MDELMQASDILGLDDLRTKAVKVKQWGNRIVRIRELDLAQGMAIFAKATEDKVIMSAEDIAQVVVFGVVNEKGAPVFTEEDIPKLVTKSRNALMFLYNEIMNLSGSAEDAGKNSEASQR